MAKETPPEQIELALEVKTEILELLDDLPKRKGWQIDSLIKGTLLAFNELLNFSRQNHLWKEDGHSHLLRLLGEELILVGDVVALPLQGEIGRAPQQEKASDEVELTNRNPTLAKTPGVD